MKTFQVKNWEKDRLTALGALPRTLCEAGRFLLDRDADGKAFRGWDKRAKVAERVKKELSGPTYAYYYKDAVTGQFGSYDPSNPPPPAELATTTTDNGTTVPYIVRVETGYLDRDQYSDAMLWQPDTPWAPWAPQPQWDHKLVITHGASCGADHTTSTAPSTSAAGSGAFRSGSTRSGRPLASSSDSSPGT